MSSLKYCEKCKEYIFSDWIHCDRCKLCINEDHSNFKYCEDCGKCVGKSFFHNIEKQKCIKIEYKICKRCDRYFDFNKKTNYCKYC